MALVIRRRDRAIASLALVAPLLIASCAAESSRSETDSEALTLFRPGDVVFSASETLPSLDAKAWLILYNSTDSLDQPIVVSGTVIVPNSAWTGAGSRPIIAFAHETVGVTDNCAPSKALSQGTYMETSSISKALAKGWAVAVSDYEGLGTAGNHTYALHRSEGHTVLDSVRAATRMRETGLSASAPVAIWGYSQGGGGAVAAAELAPSYAPELPIKGVAAGGVTADLNAIATNLDGSLFYGFLASAALGFDTAYPELNLRSYLNAEGKRIFGAIEDGTQSGCLLDMLVVFPFRRTTDYTTTNPLPTPAWQRRLAENKLGLVKPNVPAFLYHGDLDEIIPLAVGTGMRDRWCALGATVKWGLYPFGEHLVAQSLAENDAVQWISDRFAGLPAPNSCPR